MQTNLGESIESARMPFIMNGYETPGRAEVRLVNLANSPRFAPHMCSICQQGFPLGNETSILNCGHVFHVQCIDNWLEQVR